MPNGQPNQVLTTETTEADKNKKTATDAVSGSATALETGAATALAPAQQDPKPVTPQLNAANSPLTTDSVPLQNAALSTDSQATQAAEEQETLTATLVAQALKITRLTARLDGLNQIKTNLTTERDALQKIKSEQAEELRTAKATLKDMEEAARLLTEKYNALVANKAKDDQVQNARINELTQELELAKKTLKTQSDAQKEALEKQASKFQTDLKQQLDTAAQEKTAGERNAVGAAAPVLFAKPAPLPKLQALAPPQLKTIAGFDALITCNSTFDPTGQRFDIVKKGYHGEKHAIVDYTQPNQVLFKRDDLGTFLEYFAEHYEKAGSTYGRKQLSHMLQHEVSAARQKISQKHIHNLDCNQKACHGVINNFILETFDALRKQAQLSGAVVLWIQDTNTSFSLQYNADTVTFSKQDFDKFLKHYGEMHYCKGYDIGICTDIPSRESSYNLC